MSILSKIMLTCKQATELISVQRFRKLSIRERVQLKLHITACIYCKRFEEHNHIIDQSLDQLYIDTTFINGEKLSEEKKSEIKNTVTQRIKE